MLSPLITRLASTVFAILLLVVAIVTLLEVSAGWLGNDPVVLDRNFANDLRMRAWDDQSSVIVIAALFFIGAVAVLIGLRANTKLTLASNAIDGVHVERRSLEQSLKRRLERLDGVESAHVRASSKIVKVKLESGRQLHRGVIGERAAAEVADWTRSYGLDPAIKVSLGHRSQQ
jgi:hypothetical protein